MTKAWRIHSTPGGMKSGAATTPEQAGDDVARALKNGARSVEVEEFQLGTIDDLSDAWGCGRMLAEVKSRVPDRRDTVRPAPLAPVIPPGKESHFG